LISLSLFSSVLIILFEILTNSSEFGVVSSS
jgi:hypothetical protein